MSDAEQPEHADFNTDGHMHDCLFDKHLEELSECTKDCAAWLYALWTRELEKRTNPVDGELAEKLDFHRRMYGIKDPDFNKEMTALFAAHIQAAERKAEAVHLENYRWLLGLGDDFPQSEPGKRYNWRPELRKRIPEGMLRQLNQPGKEK